ncbi:MAG: hypothetical protein CL677_02390 [Bdellovibrionaceae bacterium]|nr:hypothetical protein [Pseudobdellovibrionaceae bacterium]|tara:strand:+ start:35782 stop:36372 length:591 start_codon:yes stop_codon:yes gene_type:complete
MPIMAKKNHYPTRLFLSEIPEDGALYTYSKESGELNDALKDLIGDHPYTVEIQIQPMGDVFKLTGQVTTKMDQICSRCAIELQEPIHCEFDELLMVDDPSHYKNGSQSRGHYSSEFKENEPFCHYVKSDEFNVEEFIHEMIAINEPLRPLGRPECEISCENYNKAIEKGWISSENEQMSQDRQNPFSALKGMKLNS